MSKVSSGVSKHGRNDFPAPDVKADDLREMFMAMTEEVRVIIVKLADRLHNMRTLESLADYKRKRIADETLAFFAPLAKLLGMYRVKDELEKLAFSWADPVAYARMQRHFDQLAKEQGDAIMDAKRALNEAFTRDEFLNLTCEKVVVDACSKELYSVHRKLQERGLDSVDSVNDVAQLRISLHLRQPADGAALHPLSSGSGVCYHVLGIVHALLTPVLGRVKDYIAMPKGNGYKALHTCVLINVASKKSAFPLELQIRTADMHRCAELGITADPDEMAFWHDSARNALRLAYRNNGAGNAGELRPLPQQQPQLQQPGRSRYTERMRNWQKEFVEELSPRDCAFALRKKGV